MGVRLPDRPAGQRGHHQGNAFRDEPLVPQTPILLRERDQLADGTGTGRPPT